VEPEPHRAIATRVAEVIEGLAPRTDDPHLRVQLHALAGVVANLGVDPLGGDPDDVIAVDAALAQGDESAAIRVARRVAAARRQQLTPIDWSRASGS
jgi:hypothetical protein